MLADFAFEKRYNEHKILARFEWKTMISTNGNAYDRTRLIRFGIPVALFFIVLFYETWEHIIITGTFIIDMHWSSEILFFGIIKHLHCFIKIIHN